MAHPALSTLLKYGLEAESKLLVTIACLVGEPITKTTAQNDMMDMVGATTFSELKRRSRDYSYCDEKIKREGWLMPSSKIMKGWEELSNGKKVFFFYFWMCDKSLWMYELKEGDFSQDGSHFIPKGHYDSQLHVRIPQKKWTQCGNLSDVAFEEDVCWIE